MICTQSFIPFYIFIIASNIIYESQPVEAQVGTYFIQRNQVYATYSSWLLTLTYDMGPYKEHIRAVEREILDFKLAFLDLQAQANLESDVITNKHTNNTKLIIQDILYLLERESIQLQMEVTRIKDTFDELINLATRQPKNVQKRSLLPFIGSILSKLFGTSTVSDVKELKRLIASLANSQSKVIHVVEEGLTVLNQTHVYIEKHQNVLNQLINATNMLEKQMQILYREMKQVIEPEITYMQLTTRIHDIFHIVTTVVRNTRFHLLDLSSLILHSSHGAMSTALIAPTELESVLRNIKKQLPNDLTLPYHLSAKGLIEYYKGLSTMLIPDKESFHVVTALPIVQTSDIYHVY
jgi:hypothetical protein